MKASNVPLTTQGRPWPSGPLPWIMRQTWRELLFAHWPVRPEALRPYVPSVFPLDTWEGEAWLGIVPFRVSGARVRLLPPIPGMSAFPELNVRTYITLNGKPGVYFFSLDAANALVVTMARLLYRLPYRFAAMNVSRGDSGAVLYASRLPGKESIRFEASYRPVSEVYHAEPGSLEHWLTERYCLYTLSARREPLRCDIDHPPWPLRKAEAEIVHNTMAAGLGLLLPDPPPLLHYAEVQHVSIWPLVKADR